MRRAKREKATNQQQYGYGLMCKRSFCYDNVNLSPMTLLPTDEDQANLIILHKHINK